MSVRRPRHDDRVLFGSAVGVAAMGSCPLVLGLQRVPTLETSSDGSMRRLGKKLGLLLHAAHPLLNLRVKNACVFSARARVLAGSSVGVVSGTPDYRFCANSLHCAATFLRGPCSLEDNSSRLRLKGTGTGLISRNVPLVSLGPNRRPLLAQTKACRACLASRRPWMTLSLDSAATCSSGADRGRWSEW